MYIKNVFKKDFLLLVLSCFLMAVSALDGITSPYFLGELTNLITKGDFQYLSITLLLWGVSLSFILVAMTSDKFVYGKIIQNVNTRFKMRVLQHAYSHDGMQKPSSMFSSTTLSDMREIESNYLLSVKGIIYCILQASVTLGFLMYINWKVGMIFIVLGSLPAIVPKFTAKWMQTSTTDWQDANRAYVKNLEDSLESRTLVKREQIEQTIFQNAKTFLKRLEAAYLMMKLKQAGVSSLISIVYVWTIVASFYFCIQMVVSGEVSAGVLLTAYMSADRVVSPIISIAQFYNQMLTVKPILDNVHQMTEDTRELPVIERTNDHLIVVDNATLKIGEQSLLEQFSLTIESGDKVLIRGASGSGKSTLLRALLGERALTSGKIYYHNTFSPMLYENIGVIDQNPYIFNSTLAFNLSLGKYEDDAVLIDALKKVGLAHLASKDILAESVGKDGRLLSNGEIKRLAVARALLSGKKIMIIDEVLSGLDDVHAKQIQTLIFDNFETIIEVEHHIQTSVLSRYTKIIDI